MQQNHLFDAKFSAPESDGWLDRKVQRREQTDSLKREALSNRTEGATSAAQDFLESMNRKAQMRDGIERKSEELRKLQQDMLKRKADEYRERLRNKLRPELRDS